MPRKGKNLGGRPTVMTAEKIKKLEEAFALDCTIKEACLYADISIQTLYNRQEADPKLFERFELLREQPVLTARQSVINNMKKDGDLALKYLERKRKNEFSPRQEIEHSGSLDIGQVLQEIGDGE